MISRQIDDNSRKVPARPWGFKKKPQKNKLVTKFACEPRDKFVEDFEGTIIKYRDLILP